ncbi:MAG: transposase [Candidatus Ratteibacteria bacterium]|nr:transposase [Candidatus Ratteibacteria bacterium]
MPNHIHGIINIAVGAALCSRPLINPYIGPIQNNKNNIIGNKNRINAGENIVSPLQYDGLGQYISWFKRMATNKYIRNVKNNNWRPFNKRLWQRNYHDHIIRNDKSLNNIRNYIITNPATWNMDENNIKNYSSEGKACLAPTA